MILCHGGSVETLAGEEAELFQAEEQSRISVIWGSAWAASGQAYPGLQVKSVLTRVHPLVSLLPPCQSGPNPENPHPLTSLKGSKCLGN